MESEYIYEDFEREAVKEALYLYEKEHELWLWWQEQLEKQEGSVRIEEIEEEKEKITNPPPF